MHAVNKPPRAMADTSGGTRARRCAMVPRPSVLSVTDMKQKPEQKPERQFRANQFHFEDDSKK
jgi:hypothetical protein